MDQDLETRLRELLDKQEIHDTLMRYVRGVDRGDAELLTTIFHPDAVADHGHSKIYGHNVHEVVPPVTRANQTGMHFIGNVLIELYGDVAIVEAYLIFSIELELEGEVSMVWRGGRYVDRWERRDGGPWKIADRKLVGAWDRVDPVLARNPGHDSYLPSRPAPEDFIYQRVDKGQETSA